MLLRGLEGWGGEFFVGKESAKRAQKHGDFTEAVEEGVEVLRAVEVADEEESMDGMTCEDFVCWA